MKQPLVFRRIQAAVAAGLLLHLGSMSALAAGFSLPETSALGTALSNAVVANPEEKGAFAYNPAAMGFHDQSSVSLGVLLIGPDFDLATDTGRYKSNGADWVAAPMIQAALRVHDRWRIGLGVNAPFGLETRWKTGTFPKLSGEMPTPVAPNVTLPLPFGAHPTAAKLEVVALVPTLVYKVSEDLSIGAGLDYYIVDTARLDSSLTSLTGDGDAWGWNASLLYRRGAFSAGAAYHSAATAELEGRYKPLNAALVALGETPPAQTGELDVNLPWRLQLGVRYELTPALAAEFDWTRTGWSEFDKLEAKSKRTGAELFSSRHDWEDTNAYRLGLTYDLLPGTQLRFGYAFDETGQPRDHFSAYIPDNDRHLFSLGLGQDLGKGWAFEVGYMYAKFEDHNYRGGNTYTPVADLGNEINGTDALDGDYEANAHLIALEVSKTF